MPACRSSTKNRWTQETEADIEGVKVEEIERLDEVTDLSGTVVGDGQERKKNRLDARRSKQARLKRRTISREDKAIENPCAAVERMACGSGDPFNSLPDVANGETSVLSYHYNTVFVKTTIPPGNRNVWFSYALTDPALFHATLFISASHLSAIRRTPVVPSFYTHRGEVIRLVNERLRNGEESAATDTTIGAVAALLVTDSLAGHPERVKAHIQGLKQLLAVRGGMEMLNPLVLELVGWVDVLAASSLQSLPPLSSARLRDPNLLLYYRPPSASTSAHVDALSTRLLNFTGSVKGSVLAGRIFWGLRNVTLDREIANDVHHLSTGIQFSDRTETLEREIQRLLHEVLAPHPDPDSGLPDPCLPLRLFGYASLIYVALILRDLLDNILTVRLAQLLEAALDIPDSELNELLGTFPDLMLWTLFLAGGCARPKSKIWFAKTASRILRVMKIGEMGGIKEAATKFLWPEDGGRAGYDPTQKQLDVEVREERKASDLNMMSGGLDSNLRIRNEAEVEKEGVGLDAPKRGFPAMVQHRKRQQERRACA